jgi:hypothetical protein
MSQDPEVLAETGLHATPHIHIEGNPPATPPLADHRGECSLGIDAAATASRPNHARVLLTGARTSAYVVSVIATAWPRALAVPGTNLLVAPERYLLEIARSGDSPKSISS